MLVVFLVALLPVLQSQHTVNDVTQPSDHFMYLMAAVPALCCASGAIASECC
jgi:hypothetical protein